jgi:hypothetical protein
MQCNKSSALLYCFIIQSPRRRGRRLATRGASAGGGDAGGGVPPQHGATRLGMASSPTSTGPAATSLVSASCRWNLGRSSLGSCVSCGRSCTTRPPCLHDPSTLPQGNPAYQLRPSKRPNGQRLLISGGPPRPTMAHRAKGCSVRDRADNALSSGRDK